MGRQLRRVLGQLDFRVLFTIAVLALVATVLGTLGQTSSSSPTVESIATWDDLARKCLDVRQTGWPLIVPEDAIRPESVKNSILSLGLGGLQNTPSWYWGFNLGTFYYSAGGQIAQAVTSGTEVVIYEDMVSRTVGVLSVFEGATKHFEVETQYAAPLWPSLQTGDALETYLTRELSKRRVVAVARLVSVDDFTRAQMSEARKGALLSKGLPGKERKYYTSPLTNIEIVGMSAGSSGLTLRISCPTGYVGTTWSVYSYGEPACLIGSLGSTTGGPPSPGTNETTNATCFCCDNGLSNTFSGLAGVWIPLVTNLVLTNTAYTTWTDTQPMGQDATSNPVHRFYALGNSGIDSDGDGLSDALEQFVVKTSTNAWDTDGDSLPDGWEYVNGLNPLAVDAAEDPDYDGYPNSEEYAGGSNPQMATSTPFVTFYVDGSTGSDSNNGSYTQRFQSIARALTAAQNNERVYVFSGTYLGASNRDLSYAGKAIYLRSLDNNPTSVVVDAEKMGRGFAFVSGERSNSVLEAITVMHGWASLGGGVYCRTSSPTIARCSFVENIARTNGGGIHLEGSNARIDNCDIERNESLVSGGGGIAVLPHLYYTGGIPSLVSAGSSPLITDTHIIANQCATYYGSNTVGGAGLYVKETLQYYAPPYFTSNNHFIGTAWVERCEISGNGPDDVVAAVFAYNHAELVLVNCDIVGNAARGLYNALSMVYVIHCTIANNGDDLTGLGGGVLAAHQVSGIAPGFTTVFNSLAWGNAPESDQVFTPVSGPSPAPTNCQVWYTCRNRTHTNVVSNATVFVAGNLTNDPVITRSGHLRPGSACLNTASTWISPSNDVQREARPNEGGPDMGADELRDGDADGLPDWWESEYFGDSQGGSASGDLDGDGLTNGAEYAFGASPDLSDTDEDGVPDMEEVAQNTEPARVSGDRDRDGLTDDWEKYTGTGVQTADTDGDGFGDGLEEQTGSNPTNSTSVPGTGTYATITVTLADPQNTEDVWRVVTDKCVEVVNNLTHPSGATGEIRVATGTSVVFRLVRIPANQSNVTDEAVVSFGSTNGCLATNPASSALYQVLPYVPSNTPPDPSGLFWEIYVPRVTVDVHPSDAETHKIASSLGTHSNHFVCVKNTGDIVLQAVVKPSDPALLKQIVWQTDGATNTCPALADGDKRKMKLPSNDAMKVPTRVSFGGSRCWSGTVWVVWADLSSDYSVSTTELHPDDAISMDDDPRNDGHLGLSRYDNFWFGAAIEWRSVIGPAAIITDTDRPNLLGNANNPPAGAVKKWDVTREKQVKVWIDGALTTSDHPFDQAQTWTNWVSDDSSALADEEDDNPYDGPRSNPSGPPTGDIFSYDNVKFSEGQAGDDEYFGARTSLVRRLIFRESARVQLGTTWYRCSDYGNWRAFRAAVYASPPFNWVEDPSGVNIIDESNSGF